MAQIKNILKATRINRTFPILLIFLIPFAFTNSNLKIYFIFVLSTIFAYSSIAILNAIKDNDYPLQKNSKKIAIIIFLIAIFISLLNKYSFYYISTAISLGIIYNELSRKIPLGDSLIAGLTHYSLPLLFSGLAINMHLNTLIPLSIISFFIAPAIAPTTNIKDIKKDLRKKYKSLVSIMKNPKQITIYGLILLFIIMNLQLLILSPKNLFYSLSLIFFIYLISKSILNNQFKIALYLLRTYITIQLLFTIILISTCLNTIIIALIINIINILYSIRRINYFRKIILL